MPVLCDKSLSLSLSLFFSGPAFVMSGQPSAWGGSTPGGCGPAEGGVGSGWVWSRRPVRALTKCPVPFSHANGTTPCQEVSSNPHHYCVKTILPGAWKCWSWVLFIPVVEGYTGTEGPLLSHSSGSGGCHPCWHDTPSSECGGHHEGLWMPGWGVQWRTIHLSCGHLHPCVPGPLGCKVGLSFLPRPSSIQMPSGITKRRFIPQGLPTHIN